MPKQLTIDGSLQPRPATRYVTDDTRSEGPAQESLDPKRAADKQSEAKLERRRETNRRAQANFRSRRQEALQQAEDAVQACQAECAKARARRDALQSAGRDLNARLVRASAGLLTCLRNRADALSNSDPTMHDVHASAGSHTRPPSVTMAPQPTGCVLAPLHVDVIDPETAPDPPPCDAAPPLMWHDSAGAMADSDNVDSTVPVRFDTPDIGGSRRMAAQLRGARRAAAEAAGVAPEAVRWVLQSPHAAPNGAPLSFTSESVSSRCMVSMYACFFISLLEEALLAAALTSVRSGPGGGVGGAHGMAGQNGATNGVTDVSLELKPGAQAMPPLKGPAHHHSGTLAALDNALHGTHSLADAPLALRCALDGRVKVSRAIPHIITTICRGTRAFLPRPMWLQACGLFVHFMGRMLRHKPLAMSTCPHQERGPDGETVHNVLTCPRCCVFAHMFATLRDEIAVALEGEAWSAEVVPLAKLRARWGDLYGFCGLMTTQCMEDQPVLYRQMMSGMRERISRGLVQEQQAVLDLFRQLRLSTEQQKKAADAWRVWSHTRTTLDHLLQAALLPLSTLINLPDLMLDSCPAHSTHAVRSIERCGWGTPSEPASKGTLPPLHKPNAAGVHDVGMHDAGTAKAVSARGRDVQGPPSGAHICLCEECAANMALRLLGVCGASSATATRALGAVSELHWRDAKASVEQLRAICKPGVIFDTEQCARQTELVLQRGVFTDWVCLCKMASEELQHSELASQLQRCCGAI